MVFKIIYLPQSGAKDAFLKTLCSLLPWILQLHKSEFPNLSGLAAQSGEMGKEGMFLWEGQAHACMRAQTAIARASGAASAHANGAASTCDACANWTMCAQTSQLLMWPGGQQDTAHRLGTPNVKHDT